MAADRRSREAQSEGIAQEVEPAPRSRPFSSCFLLGVLVIVLQCLRCGGDILERRLRLAGALADGAGVDDIWNLGTVDLALKRIQAQIEALVATDKELHELSGRYARMTRHTPVGTTRPALLARERRAMSFAGSASRLL